MLFAAFYDETQFKHVRMVPATGFRYRLCSNTDGSWKYETAAPEDDDWMRAGYNDSSWRPMVPMPMPQETETMAAHRLRRIVELGGKPVGASAQAADVVRVRHVFTLDPTAESSSPEA
jgi:hypothetical protein